MGEISLYIDNRVEIKTKKYLNQNNLTATKNSCKNIERMI